MGRKRNDIADWTTEPALMRVRSLAMRGLTQDQIAESLGLPVRTLKRWISPKNQRPEAAKLREAVASGREVAIATVENALYKRAISGDLGAICYFLNNRAADRWSNHPELKGMDGKVVFIDDIPQDPAAGPTAAEPAASDQLAADTADRADHT